MNTTTRPVLPRLLRHLVITLLVLLAVLAAMVLWPMQPPPPLASIAQAARRIDTSGLPPLQQLAARDGAALAFRAYGPAQSQRVAVLVHGSSADSRNMHRVGLALAEAGIAAYALDMRGHGASGPRGDVPKVGQLDDDIADVVAELKRRHPGAALSMIGFSSGGGFTLRTAGGANGERFDRYVMVSPMLHQKAPTARPDTGGWVKVNMPRAVALTILDRLGIEAFGHLPVLAFALPPEAAAQRTTMYSYRLQLSFRPHEDYLGDVRAIRRPATVIVGANDELFRAEAYAPLLEPIQPRLKVKLLPGLGHIDMVVEPSAIGAIVTAAF
ncbi:lysophospholipase [Piscinibacter aquaticus]|uniref:Lysophospholipase n=1 Tax=Piscinibacter aquaticus TaxID=392597 RepID=A0A5C6U070_9BURK|nr:lysophospholipase [Piscinibacter aquaticus]